MKFLCPDLPLVLMASSTSQFFGSFYQINSSSTGSLYLSQPVLSLTDTIPYVPRLSFPVFVGRRNILSEESHEHIHAKIHINNMFHHLLSSLWSVEKAIELWKWRNSIWQQKVSLSVDERSNESMYFWWKTCAREI